MSRLDVELIPVEHLHQQFDEAYDRAELLRDLIAQREPTGIDVTILYGKLKEAEREKKFMLAALRRARHLKAVPMLEPDRIKPREVSRLAGRR